MSPLGFRRKSKAEAAAAVDDDDADETPAPAARPAPARGGVRVEKPKANIYTVLLILSFVAVVIGCICLYAEINAYEWKLKP